MGITANDLYSSIQGVFRRGLTIIVGSGASCHYGLPSMGALADHLQRAIPAASDTLCEQGTGVFDTYDPADRIFVLPTVSTGHRFEESAALICDWRVGDLW